MKWHRVGRALFNRQNKRIMALAWVRLQSSKTKRHHTNATTGARSTRSDLAQSAETKPARNVGPNKYNNGAMKQKINIQPNKTNVQWGLHGCDAKRENEPAPHKNNNRGPFNPIQPATKCWAETRSNRRTEQITTMTQWNNKIYSIKKEGRAIGLARARRKARKQTGTTQTQQLWPVQPDRVWREVWNRNWLEPYDRTTTTMKQCSKKWILN